MVDKCGYFSDHLPLTAFVKIPQAYEMKNLEYSMFYHKVGSLEQPLWKPASADDVHNYQDCLWQPFAEARFLVY